MDYDESLEAIRHMTMEWADLCHIRLIEENWGLDWLIQQYAWPAERDPLVWSKFELHKDEVNLNRHDSRRLVDLARTRWIAMMISVSEAVRERASSSLSRASDLRGPEPQ